MGHAQLGASDFLQSLPRRNHRPPRANGLRSGPALRLAYPDPGETTTSIAAGLRAVRHCVTTVLANRQFPGAAPATGDDTADLPVVRQGGTSHFPACQDQRCRRRTRREIRATHRSGQQYSLCFFLPRRKLAPTKVALFEKRYRKPDDHLKWTAMDLGSKSRRFLSKSRSNSVNTN